MAIVVVGVIGLKLPLGRNKCARIVRNCRNQTSHASPSLRLGRSTVSEDTHENTHEHTNTHTRTHARTYPGTCAHAQTHTHMHACIHTHTYIYTHTHTRTHAHTHTRTHAHTHAQARTHRHRHTHTFRCTHRTHNCAYMHTQPLSIVKRQECLRRYAPPPMHTSFIYKNGITRKWRTRQLRFNTIGR